MSTRANIIIKDAYNTLYFYRHSDGYPSVAANSLRQFLRWVIDGKIRSNASQAAGWLILLGADEYGSFINEGSPRWWKCGAYEPTTDIHGDVEFIYIIDLDRRAMSVYEYHDQFPQLFEMGKLGPALMVIDETNIDQEVK